MHAELAKCRAVIASQEARLVAIEDQQSRGTRPSDKVDGPPLNPQYAARDRTYLTEVESPLRQGQDLKAFATAAGHMHQFSPDGVNMVVEPPAGWSRTGSPSAWPPVEDATTAHMGSKVYLPDGKVHTKNRHELNRYQQQIFPQATAQFHSLLVAIWLRDTFLADQNAELDMDVFDFSRQFDHFVEMLGANFADSVLQVDVSRAKVSKSPEFGAAMQARRRPAEPLTFSPVGAKMIESVDAQVDSQVAKAMADKRIASMAIRNKAAQTKDHSPATGSAAKAVPRPARQVKFTSAATGAKPPADKTGASAP